MEGGQLPGRRRPVFVVGHDEGENLGLSNEIPAAFYSQRQKHLRAGRSFLGNESERGQVTRLKLGWYWQSGPDERS